jgi:CRP-like cAMP-binding protein
LLNPEDALEQRPALRSVPVLGPVEDDMRSGAAAEALTEERSVRAKASREDRPMSEARRDLPGPRSPELLAFLATVPPTEFAIGETILDNTYLQPDRGQPAEIAYVREGLALGAWHRPAIDRDQDSAVLVVGDGNWIGLDAFKYGENLFRYSALAPTTAWVFPLSTLVEAAPREVVLDALRSVSLAWCTAVSVVSLKGQGIERRAMLLLYNLARIHPRPDLRITQQVVAELLGVSRQSVSPVLKRLEEKGLVRLGYGKVAVQDPKQIIEELRRTAAGRAQLDSSPGSLWTSWT